MKPNHFQHHRRNYNSPKLFKKKKISKKLRPLPFNHNVCHFHVRVCCRCLLASPSADVKSLRCVAAASCYRGGKGSGGLSGAWWEAETFIPGTRTAREKRRASAPLCTRLLREGLRAPPQSSAAKGGLIEAVTNRPNYKA